eukprot:snap_masked-scaffold_8-processed-gene-8.47-mRNA-1 protein AED:1.00 eAED:1.00 QI:0/-1/0/0/-1/1/1/0/101
MRPRKVSKTLSEPSYSKDTKSYLSFREELLAVTPKAAESNLETTHSNSPRYSKGFTDTPLRASNREYNLNWSLSRKKPRRKDSLIKKLTFSSEHVIKKSKI